MRPSSPPGNVSPQFLTKKFSNELTRSLQQFKREDERNNEPWIHATYYEKLQKCDTFKGTIQSVYNSTVTIKDMKI